MAFHPYPQLIPSVFNLSGFAPPQPLTAASHWPWVDHPASGPGHATKPPYSDSLSLRLPHKNGLTSRHAADSQAHSSKGTPSHTNGALTDCKRMVSGTLSLPSRGTFHHSLTVLSAIGHTEYSGLPGGPGRFTADSTSPLLLGNTNNTTTHTFTYRTIHLLRCTIPDASADVCASRLQSAACNTCAPQHRTRNPCQVSHAHGLASSAIARHYTRNHNCFLLLRVLRCFTSPRQPPHRL